MRLFERREPWINELKGLLSDVEDHLAQAPNAAFIAEMFERQHEDMVAMNKGLIELASVLSRFLDLEKQYQELEKQKEKQFEETEADKLF